MNNISLLKGQPGGDVAMGVVGYGVGAYKVSSSSYVSNLIGCGVGLITSHPRSGTVSTGGSVVGNAVRVGSYVEGLGAGLKVTR